MCIPYFKDIYKVINRNSLHFQDLASRSDDKQKGINKISLLEVDNIILMGVSMDNFLAFLANDSFK